LPRWRIPRIKSIPATFLGYVEAQDPKAAIDKAVKQFDIPEGERDRILAQRVS
jgi:hypothetical protein